MNRTEFDMLCEAAKSGSQAAIRVLNSWSEKIGEEFRKLPSELQNLKEQTWIYGENPVIYGTYEVCVRRDHPIPGLKSCYPTAAEWNGVSWKLPKGAHAGKVYAWRQIWEVAHLPADEVKESVFNRRWRELREMRGTVAIRSSTGRWVVTVDGKEFVGADIEAAMAHAYDAVFGSGR